LKILAGSDVAVLPSREEGVSTMLLEAIALKVSIVATRVGGTIEILRHNNDALLVNPDPREIKNAITRLLADTDFARKLTENAYQRLLNNYEWKIVLEKILRLYKWLINSQKTNH